MRKKEQKAKKKYILKSVKEKKTIKQI